MAADNAEASWHSCVPIKLYSQSQEAAGFGSQAVGTQRSEQMHRLSNVIEGHQQCNTE